MTNASVLEALKALVKALEDSDVVMRYGNLNTPRGNVRHAELGKAYTQAREVVAREEKS